MNFIKTFKSISSECGEDVAILVVQMISLTVTKKFKKRHSKRGLFTKELKKKIEKTLFEHKDTPEYELALRVWEVFPEWEIHQTVGGCGPKTFKELLKNQGT